MLLPATACTDLHALDDATACYCLQYDAQATLPKFPQIIQDILLYDAKCVAEGARGGGIGSVGVPL